MKIEAHAKINLGLDVTGRREDGYHLVRMIMQALELHDTLYIEEIARPGVELEIEQPGAEPKIARPGAEPKIARPGAEPEIARPGAEPEIAHPGVELEIEQPGAEPEIAQSGECTGKEDAGSNKTALAADKSNLIVRAAELLLGTCAPEKGVRIRLIKRIPLAAGLAGGSADAAATLRGINELLHLNLTNTELCRLGVRLGADIPYCILGGTALSEGIGEVLTTLPDLPPCHIVLGKPQTGMSTAEAYRALDALEDIIHPDIDGQIRSLQKGDLTGVAERLGNVLEPVTAARQPEVEKIRRQLMEAGAAGARMSGSGPTVFGIFTEEEKAKEACSVLKRVPGREVILTAPAQNGRDA